MKTGYITKEARDYILSLDKTVRRTVEKAAKEVAKEFIGDKKMVQGIERIVKGEIDPNSSTIRNYFKYNDNGKKVIKELRGIDGVKAEVKGEKGKIKILEAISPTLAGNRAVKLGDKENLTERKIVKHIEYKYAASIHKLQRNKVNSDGSVTNEVSQWRRASTYTRNQVLDKNGMDVVDRALKRININHKAGNYKVSPRFTYKKDKANGSFSKTDSPDSIRQGTMWVNIYSEEGIYTGLKALYDRETGSLKRVSKDDKESDYE